MESSLRVGGVEERSGSTSQPTSASHCAEQALVGLSGACSPTTAAWGHHGHQHLHASTSTSGPTYYYAGHRLDNNNQRRLLLTRHLWLAAVTRQPNVAQRSPTWHNADSLSTPDSYGKTERHSQAQSELRGPISGLYDIKSDCKSSDVLYYSFPEMVDLVEEVEPMQQG